MTDPHLNPLFGAIFEAHTRPVPRQTVTPHKYCVREPLDKCVDCSPNCEGCDYGVAEELCKEDERKANDE